MFLFYIDESGNKDNPADTHFVLGGVAVFERVALFMSQSFDEVRRSTSLEVLRSLSMCRISVPGKIFGGKIFGGTLTRKSGRRC
jgi:hypothetical protein